MSGDVFVQSDGRANASLEWYQAVQRGELVSAAQRNAFVAQSSTLMDALAAPGEMLRPGAQIPTATYRGPISQYNGHNVPLVGSIRPPEAWKARGALPEQRFASSDSFAAMFEPTQEERRRMWLALYDTQKSMRTSFEVVRVERDAGALPVVAVVVLAIAGIGALAAVVAHAVSTQIREAQETARHAAQIQQAAAEYVQRLQAWSQARQTNPAAPMPPPGPSETAVSRSPAAGTPSPAAERERNVWEDLAKGAERALWVGGGLVALSVAAPPILSAVRDMQRGER